MSREAVEAIIGKAVTNSEFRQSLFANPDEVLAGYELTEDEMAALKSIGVESLESFAGSLDERISKLYIIEGFTRGIWVTRRPPPPAAREGLGPTEF